VQRAFDADPHEEDHDREEQHEVGEEVDHALLALGEVVPEDVGAHVRALVQRVAAGEHEARAVRHGARLEHPDRGRAEEVARADLVRDDRHEEDQRQREEPPGAVRKAIDGADGGVEGRREVPLAGVRGLVVHDTVAPPRRRL
jgi:hypothetical protein